MQQNRSMSALARLVAYIVLAYGLIIIASALARQLHSHPGHRFDVLLISVPQITGLGFTYLGTLLMRQKYNAWLAALMLFGISIMLGVVHVVLAPAAAAAILREGLILPVLIVLLLLMTRNMFRVRSDSRSFIRAVRVALLLLAIAFVYGIAGFVFLDRHDLRRDITLLGAAHQTVDQIGLTTQHPVAYTHRARLFLDSLPVISMAALTYVVVSFFDPIRARLVSQTTQRKRTEELLRTYPSDIDDFFKLWPHDKLYHFNKDGDAGLAYHAAKGTALVVGDPFGNPKQFLELCRSFQELCFVNDWRPAFVHVSARHASLYAALGLRMQKLGEEAILDLEAFRAHRNAKYFRQIRNRFIKQGYTVHLLEPPHSADLLRQLAAISEEWLERPGRAERGLTMGYYTSEYMQLCQIAVVQDANATICGFINMVPTFEPGLANYDLLRCSASAPGNCNDFLLLGLIDILSDRGIAVLNLGLSPLAGLNEDAENAGVIDTALRFIYANSDRFFSFSGLQRFKAKYHPDWEDRYFVYSGNAASFARSMTALTRAMKI